MRKKNYLSVTLWSIMTALEQWLAMNGYWNNPPIIRASCQCLCVDTSVGRLTLQMFITNLLAVPLKLVHISVKLILPLLVHLTSEVTLVRQWEMWELHYLPPHVYEVQQKTAFNTVNSWPKLSTNATSLRSLLWRSHSEYYYLYL